MRLIIHSDGGARGNPGPAAIGAVIENENKGLVAEISKYIGIATNNVAEYSALIEGLEKCKSEGATEVECYLDSELVVKQLKGEYKVKDSNMQKLYAKVKNLETDFKIVSFSHVPRAENKHADKLVNQALDAQR